MKYCQNAVRKVGSFVRNNKVGTGLLLAFVAPASFAADTSYDTSTIVAGFAAATAAAIVVSLAWTSSTYSIKGARLLRKG
ncbi:hypothetical protein [Luteibacter sp.]|uniref:hypothetical protein n=1 Tax=Luteibacter sp. TaxID=1886636 RepID=UPI003F7DED60